MNLQQLEYIVAVERYKHFVTAAEKCFVTQATLSMMIKKLEDELGVKIFDRAKQPVVPTVIGEKIIEQAKVVLREVARIKEIVKEETAQVKGELKIGIIPTLAPYLLPLFLKSFLAKYPEVKLQLSELTTSEIIERIKHSSLDAGILAIPLSDPDLIEQPLFSEEFVIYFSEKHAQSPKMHFSPADLDVSQLWLLDEGHCMRNQVINLCGLKLEERSRHRLDLSASSIETLKKVVDINEGITVLPYLALRDLTKAQLRRVRYFKPPVPVRKIGLVSFRYFVKEKMLDALKAEILSALPPEMLSEKNKKVIEISLE
ncbi:MAG: LysR substrate-binding domain-containing protein [Chloroherpetonaceae bacterium]|nr:LysR substrate-binding domain-containing protein [Chloroherpetonaceae bacterium]